MQDFSQSSNDELLDALRTADEEEARRLREEALARMSGRFGEVMEERRVPYYAGNGGC